MGKRFMSIWFRHLLTDRIFIQQPQLKNHPLVLVAPERGRMVIKAASKAALIQGIHVGTVVADARAICPSLQVLDIEPGQGEGLLNRFAAWFIRYTPVVAVDPPDGLMLDISGCTHLWGGEELYLKEITVRLKSGGYDTTAAISDTIGSAWAIARFGGPSMIIEEGKHKQTLYQLPAEALRLESQILERLHKLGLHQVGSFADMPRSALRRRFGQLLPDRLAQALGEIREPLSPYEPIEPYQERLPCLEPIRTATGIEIALEKLLEHLCSRLQKEGKGLRNAQLKCYRIDGELQQIGIGTNQASRNVKHLFKLFELKVGTITPALGIELFILEAPIVEDLSEQQETLWNISRNGEETEVMKLLDRIAVRVGANAIHRYLPDEHYWPERSIKESTCLQEKPATNWPDHTLRPISLLGKPQHIDVSAPIPDYPPMLFIYKGQVHNIRKADGPERIEQEWWLQQGEHRDYYTVEDEHGARYWLFRLGHYGADNNPEWFIHGFFA